MRCAAALRDSGPQLAPLPLNHGARSSQLSAPRLGMMAAREQEAGSASGEDNGFAVRIKGGAQGRSFGGYNAAGLPEVELNSNADKWFREQARDRDFGRDSREVCVCVSVKRGVPCGKRDLLYTQKRPARDRDFARLWQGWPRTGREGRHL